jgi:hypothetical protein
MFHDVERTFLHSRHSKKRFGRCHRSDVLSRLKALRTHNVSSGRLKNDFGEVDDSMFQSVKRQLERNFCILTTEKATWMKSLK